MVRLPWLVAAGLTIGAAVAHAQNAPGAPAAPPNPPPPAAAPAPEPPRPPGMAMVRPGWMGMMRRGPVDFLGGAAGFRFRRDGEEIAIKCAANETMKACVDAAAELIDKVTSTGSH
ncbi:MAG: hypothetical protein JOY70_06040 [Acidisphaera sp.]|nr:hypothetical protein [Acidisphaera sp.]